MRPGGVLLVDDNPDDITFVRLAFRTFNMDEALTALFSGQEAMEYLGGEGLYADRTKYPIPALLLLDLRMPMVDGFDVLRWVRSHASLKRLPITIFSASDYPRDLTLAYDLGANSFLAKPLRLEQFYKTIKSATDFWLESCQLPSMPRT